MFTSNDAWWRTPPVLSFAAVGFAAALFGAGVLTAHVTNADSDPTPATTATQIVPGGPRTPAGSLVAIGQAGTGDSSAAGAMPASPNGVGIAYPGGIGCPAALGPVLSGTTIDPAKAGLTPRLLGDGFTMESLSIRAEGSCDSDGSATGTPVLDTQWRDNNTGLQLWVSQAASDKPVPNVIESNSASFSSDGYVFQVNVNAFVVAAATEPVPDAPSGSASTPASGSSVSSGPPPTDPHAAEVLQSAVAALAPSLSDACFAHQVSGGWDGLAVLGIGDPRPAIPTGWDEENVSTITYTPAARDCGAPPMLRSGSFNASYTETDASGNWQGALSISANALAPNEDTAPGFISDYGLSWSNGSFSFGVYGKADATLTRDQLVAIAKALDPTFDVSKLTEQPNGDGVEPMPAEAPGQPPAAIP